MIVDKKYDETVECPSCKTFGQYVFTLMGDIVFNDRFCCKNCKKNYEIILKWTVEKRYKEII